MLDRVSKLKLRLTIDTDDIIHILKKNKNEIIRPRHTATLLKKTRCDRILYLKVEDNKTRLGHIEITNVTTTIKKCKIEFKMIQQNEIKISLTGRCLNLAEM